MPGQLQRGIKIGYFCPCRIGTSRDIPVTLRTLGLLGLSVYISQLQCTSPVPIMLKAMPHVDVTSTENSCSGVTCLKSVKVQTLCILYIHYVKLVIDCRNIGWCSINGIFGSSFNHLSLFRLCLYIDRTISLEGDPPRPTKRAVQDHEVNQQDLQFCGENHHQ